jgi:hypothetical protein
MLDPGGFVRLSVVPYDQSDSWDAFNNATTKITCYETNCGPDDPNFSDFGPLNGPGNPECGTNLTIPCNIPDGPATIQFVWYGGGVYYAQPETSFGEYYGCIDVNVQGGLLDAQPPPLEFVGGDVSNPGQQVCKYWGYNQVGMCNFGDQKPNPVAGDLLSNSLEPCTRGPSKVGVPFEFEVAV